MIANSDILQNKQIVSLIDSYIHPNRKHNGNIIIITMITKILMVIYYKRPYFGERL